MACRRPHAAGRKVYRVGWLFHICKVIDGTAQPAFRGDLRHALNSLGQFPRMLELLREAETLAENLGDQPRLGRVTAFLVESAAM